MSEVWITQETRCVDHKNPISGHCWNTNIPLKKWTVYGAFCGPKTFNSLERAQKEKVEREEFQKKFPFKP